MMTTTANKASAIFSATMAALITLLVSFWAFRLGFIKLWEWQHEGRQIIFTFWPEMKSAGLAILASGATFLAMLRRLLRASKN